MKLNNIKNIKSRYICAIFPIIVSATYAITQFNKTFPIAEGWYTYYAQCINLGQEVYKDFEYLFFPLYINLIAIICKLFGYKIIVLRIMGILFFCLLAFISYKIFEKLFNPYIGVIASIASVLYLQSEPVQVFYDYVRFMDIFSYLSVLFLIQLINMENLNNKKRRLKITILLASVVALFTLIKQNMGILFILFLIGIYIFQIIINKNKKQILKELVMILIVYLSVIILSFILLVKTKNFNIFLESTMSGATSAKGGLWSILFNWISNGKDIFLKAIPYTCIYCIVLIVNILLYQKYKKEKISDINNIFITCIYSIVLIFGILVCFKNKTVGRKISNGIIINEYILYECSVLIWVMVGIYIIYQSAKKQKVNLMNMKIFVVSGSIFAIGYGCGTSGGLARGQLGLGLGFLIGILLYYSQHYFQFIVSPIIIGLVAANSLICANYKYINPYNWWGLTVEDIWQASYETKIPLLNGIYVSEDEKKILDNIYDIIQKNTTESDSIFCFPQIPIFYSLCNRRDPETYTKVQWFDVCTDKSVIKDIEIIKQNMPVAIIIADIPEWVISAHENAFREGNISGTNKMYNFLYDFIFENNYLFNGKYYLNQDHTISLYIRNDTDKKSILFQDGDGSKENPYLIGNLEQFCMFREQVNNGRTFEGKYIKQTCDIDLSSIKTWIPIGRYESGCYFYGTYDGAGHIIKNMNIIADENNYNVGLFGVLGGKVINLGIQSGKIEGEAAGACGGITSHSIGDKAAIINCFSGVDISAIRAGGIADNFSGVIKNCVSFGKLYGKDIANIVSFENSLLLIDSYIINNTFKQNMNSSNLYLDNVDYISKEYFYTEKFIKQLNSNILKYKEDNLNYYNWTIKNNKIDFKK